MMSAGLGELLEMRLRLPPGAHVSQSGDGDGYVVEADGRRGRVGPADAATRQVLENLSDWIALPRLFAQAVRLHDPAGGVAAREVLSRLESAGLMVEGLWADTEQIAELRLFPGSGLGPPPVALEPADRLALVPHCLAEPVDGGWRLSSPLAAGQVTVSDLKTLAPFGRTPWAHHPGNDVQSRMSGMLHRAGLAVPHLGRQPATGGLSPAGLRLHALSRRGSAPGPVGAIGQGAPDRFDAPPLPPRAGTATVKLPDPVATCDPGFHALLRQRRSYRTPARLTSLAVGEISTLLDLAVRETGRDGQKCLFPYPNAGGCPTFTVVLALSDPAGVLPALSVYDATDHALRPIAGDPAILLGDAATSMGVQAVPAGLITLAAHFDRLGGRYGDAGYALLLKNAGVILQTLHLAAIASGLGSCILGGGDSRDFAALTGYDPLRVGPIGEIAFTGPIADTSHTRERNDAR